MAELSEIANGANFKQDVANVKRSAFNMSRAWYGTATTGAVVPFDIMEVVPNTEVNLNYTVIARSRYPLRKPFKNNFRVFINSYYASLEDLVEGASNIVSGGTRQDVEKQLPKYVPYVKTEKTNDPLSLTSDSKIFNTLTPGTPLDKMGFPWQFYNSKTESGKTRNERFNGKRALWIKEDGSKPETVHENYDYKGELDTNTKLEINACPLLMYAKVWIKEELDANLYIDNKQVQPDLLDNLRIKWGFENQNVVDWGGNPTNWKTRGYINQLSYDYPFIIGSANMKDENEYTTRVNLQSVKDTGAAAGIKLNHMFFAQWNKDYFTSASLWKNLVRAGATLPKLDINIPDGKISTDKIGTLTTVGLPVQVAQDEEGAVSISPSTAKKVLRNLGVEIDGSASIDLMELRGLIAETKILESLGKINRLDFYNGYIESMFGTNPKLENYMPVKIGGFYCDMVNEITENTNGSGETPLGDIGARQRAVGKGDVGRIFCKDYGYIMSTVTIIPNTIYKGQVEKLWKKTEKADLYLPMLQGTAPQAIMNWELGLAKTGNTENNNKVFGYTKRDEEFKSRRNIVTGLAAAKATSGLNVADSLYFATREFDGSQSLNGNMLYCTPTSFHSDNFTNNLEDEWSLEIGCNVKTVAPMMAEAQPQSL